MGYSSLNQNMIADDGSSSNVKGMEKMHKRSDSDERNEELRNSIARAKQLIHELNSHVMKSPIEQNTFSTVKEGGLDSTESESGSLGEGNYYGASDNTKEKVATVSTPERDPIFEHSIAIRQHDLVTDKEVLSIVTSLVKSLEGSLRQIQQLKFKNMLIKSNNNDIQSTFEVEENLRKQQFERMKCQLIFQNQQLLETIHQKEGKIAKYKNRIIEKNRLINKLMKILNDNSISDTLRSDELGFSRHCSTPSSNKSNFSKDKANDMLRTLGLLASQVLNDEIDDDSANQTIIQQQSTYLGESV